ncbi:MAG TPA: IS607 family element RNA-guided endonuclease TnpB [Actinomycetes bacterium]|nr:IS607 family element RNA-guided endonuclease TnpB [Actinomycetes bacterium]
MTGRLFAIPDGWVARGFRFEVEPTSPEQLQRITQHFGARRYAHNWALAQIKANLDARATNPAIAPLAWSFYDLRKQWNQTKQQVAPWWRECSKEAYASGIADLASALHAWADSRHGRRAGRPVGFPKFKSRRHDRGRVRFTTGPMRLEPDRRHLILPVIGRLRSKENTRRLERLLAKQGARVLSMTVSERGGRLFVSVQAIVAQQPRTPHEPDGHCGIDLGVGAEWAVIAHHDGTVQRLAHPAPWAAVHKERRRVARQRSRRLVGSRGYRQASAKLAALDRRAANLRTNQIHTLTTTLARRYGAVVVEDLDVAAMAKSMGRRAFRRSVYQAGIGRVRRLLAYKTVREGGRLLVADRWYPSSRTHHGCGGYLAELTLGQRIWVCPGCGGLVDRNANAALNLRDWTGAVAVGDRVVQRGGVAAPVPFVGDHGGQAHLQGGRARPRKTTLVAGANDTRTKPSLGRGTPNRGTSQTGRTDAN